MAGVICGPAVSKRPRLDESEFYDSSSCASDESCYTWQGYETAWVKDSGDEWSPSSGESDSGDATDVIYEVEYEIAETSDSSNQSDSDSDSSSDLEAALIPIIAAELEEESFASSESSDDGIIRSSPIPTRRSPIDKWKCLRCGVHNVPPMRYCHKCYEIRKGWLDPMPKKRRPRRPRDPNASVDSVLDTGSVPSGSSISSTASSHHSQGSSISSQTTDSGFSSQGYYDEIAHPGCSTDTLPSKQPCKCKTDLCGLCNLRPPDGVFVHCNTGHNLYCYSCSKRVWRKRKQCPVCRRTIAKVIKVF